MVREMCGQLGRAVAAASSMALTTAAGSGPSVTAVRFCVRCAGEEAPRMIPSRSILLLFKERPTELGAIGSEADVIGIEPNALFAKAVD